jgi:hypothetical protein
MLQKYLDGMRLWPTREDGWKHSDDHWITFPAGGGFFTQDTMLIPLQELLAAKVRRYASSRTGLGDLSLVLFYNRAVLYNSPIGTGGT